MSGAAIARTQRRAAQRTSLASAQSEIHTALIHYLAGNNDFSPFRRATSCGNLPEIPCTPQRLATLFLGAIPGNLGYRQVRNLWLIATVFSPAGIEKS